MSDRQFVLFNFTPKDGVTKSEEKCRMKFLQNLNFR